MAHAHLQLETTLPYERGHHQYALKEEREELKSYQEFSAVVDPLIPILVQQGIHICELLEGLKEEKEKLWEDYRQGEVYDITRQLIKRFRNVNV
jgi:hypothetical protein